MENRHYRVPFSVDTWEEEFESMIENLDEFIASLTPAEAWEQCWVGEQSAAEFVTIGIQQGLCNIPHMVRQYVSAISDDDYSGLRTANPEQLDKVAELLLRYIDTELQYDPHGQAPGHKPGQDNRKIQF